MKTVTTLLAALALLLALGSCTLFTEGDPLVDTPTDAQLESFSTVFMSSYWAERGGAPSGDVARAVTPFLPRVADTGAARATVPVDRLEPVTGVSFADLSPTIFTDYPEPGQTTSFTASVELDSVDTDIYRIVVTTTFPSSDLRSSYVEEYFVRDGDEAGVFTSPDGNWTDDDPIVDDTWAQDQMHREKMELTFRDGTTRTETIVSASTAGGPKFDPAAFDIDGSLDLSQAFLPASGADPNVMYSSVVMYYVTPATYPSYWFWEGSVSQTVLGVRYYTEVADPAADTYTAYTASFEKTFSTITTDGGDFAGTVSGVYVGASWDALAESVLRQRVVYGLTGTAPTGDYYRPTGTGAITSRMRTRVVNAAGLRDFILDQIDDEALAISVADSTFLIPDANAEDILAEDTGSSVYLREQQVDPAEGTLRFAMVTADALGLDEPLTTVFASITTGMATEAEPTAPDSNVLPSQTVATFEGANTMGTLIPNSSVPQSASMGTAGTVEAWIYIDQYTDTAGIVHKGTELDFSDECFSLQGWGSKGQFGIILNKPAGGYDSVLSKNNLKRATWYHLVATWDTAASTPFVRLYVNGALNKSGTPSVAEYRENDHDIVVGSQLPDIYSAQAGYFGFDGKIAGVNVESFAFSGAEVLARYNASKGDTGSW